ncbi:mRNA cap guanine-N7 methyltransferase [Grifola frondosa]|uniref:mRNA cap guanine-N(7) methyltransferase n=1 Tax=Grifola frondosa TaxID=5627 RepID=A0A1C7MF47_GRIFR|nr:mRNA cap guanine-N7 methyltransferase [Grifola frondosa]
MPPPQTPHRASAAIVTTNVNNAVAAAMPLAMPPPPRAQPMPTRPISPPPKAPPPAPAPASVPGSAPAPMPTPKTQTPRPRTSSGTALPAKPLPMSVSAPSLAPSLPRKPSPVPGPSRATPDAGPSISADASSTVKRSTIPYAPTRRITPATSVLVPLSPAEMERYRNYPGGIGSMMLRRKRKREDELSGKRVLDEGEEDEESARKKRKLGDVGIVVEHYNTRPDVGVTQRQDSPIIGLKSFNNWVKSVLITRFAYPALMDSPNGQGRPGTGRGTRGRVLDMGCGKGGDLTKWSKAKVADYVGLDIAAVSIEQAQMRHASARGSRFTATFFALDCYAHVLSDVLPAPLLSTPFDVVSMQFCMHYAFESEKKARTMLQNVAGWLRRGGVFIGTIPDAEQLLDRLDALPKDAKELSFGNSVYKIRFEDRTNRPTFGHKYWFFLQDAVDDVPEYVVQWDNFVKLAAEFDLQPVYKKEFHQVFEEHHEHSEFGPLLERMRVVDANGESQMDEDQWEAANIYIAFAFEKR